MKVVGLLAVVFLWQGCGRDEPTEGLDAPAPRSPVSAHSWPTFAGDCMAGWDHTLKALNSNGSSEDMGFALMDVTPGQSGFHADLSLDFPAGASVPLRVNPDAKGPHV